MTITDTERILRAIWLKAAAQPRGLELNCGSYSSAKHYQMRLYKLARPVRDKPDTDPELFSAIERLSISVSKNDSTLRILPVAQAGVLGSLAQQIGFDPRQEAAGELQSMEERLARTLGGDGPGLEHGSNRYNTRG
jgi:hypothetical protein